MRFPIAGRLAAALALTFGCLMANGVRAQTGNVLDALPPAVCPSNGSEELYGVQNGADHKFTATQVPYCATSQPTTYTAKQTFAPTTPLTAGVNLGQGTGPTTPANGDVWITPSGVFAQVNGSTAALGVTVPTASAAGSSTQVQYNCSAVLCGASGLTISAGAASLASPTLSGTVTLPGSGTLTSTLNTFAKPVTSSVAAGGSGAYTIASGDRFGCVWATSSDAWALGSATTAGGTCVNAALTWSIVGAVNTLTLNTATAADGNFTIKDSTGATTVAAFSFPGSVPTWAVPTTGVLKVGSAGLSGSLTAGILNLGNGTYGDTTGTLNAGTLTAATRINGPSNAVTGLTSFWTSSVLNSAQPLQLTNGGNPFAATTGGDAVFGQDDTDGSGIGSFIRGSGSGGAGHLGIGHAGQYAPYANNFQFCLIANSAGQPVLCEESAAGTDNVVEIGSNSAAGDMTQATSLFLIDRVVPSGSLQSLVIDTPGTSYTQATTAAALSGGGCSFYPTLTANVNDATGQVVSIGAKQVVMGCSTAPTLTISSSGAGTGATGHTTITTGQTDASVGPLLAMGNYTDGAFVTTDTGLGWAGLATNDWRLGVTNAGWMHPFNGSAGIQAYLRFPGGVSFESPNGGTNNATFSFGEALQDCNAHAGGAAAVMLCLTTTEGGSTLAPMKMSALLAGAPTGGNEGLGTINAAGAYYANGVAGVTCSGAPSSSFASTNGIVTHC